jgi:CRISPR-associated exonuclease Cas4
MSGVAVWIVLGAVLALVLGLLLILGGQRMRRRRGLGGGMTLALDDRTLTSRRLSLTGRPDRIVKAGNTVVPEEWSSWT